VRTLKISAISIGILFVLGITAIAGPAFYIKHIQCQPNTIEIGVYLECPGYVYVFVSPPGTDAYYLIYPEKFEEEYLLCTCWYKVLGRWTLGRAGIYRFLFLVTSSPLKWCPGKPQTFQDIIYWKANNILWIIEGMAKEYCTVGSYYWMRIQ